MNPTRRFSILLLGAALCATLPLAGRAQSLPPPSPLEYPVNVAIANFVDAAAEAICQRGEDVFAEMNVEGPWYDKKSGRYVFVYDSNLVTVVNAGFPEMRGRRVGAEDPRKFFACSQLLSGARSSIWAHADWRDAATGEWGCKTAFLKIVAAPSGARYVVGSGALNVPIERRFIEELVESAANLFAAQGTNAFEALARPDGPFRFRDFYVFVDTPQCVELFNPAFPEVVGQNHFNLRGADGRYLVREYVAKAMDEGAGWTAYQWYRPGETNLSDKLTFSRKVEFDGQPYVVGAGLYVENP